MYTIVITLNVSAALFFVTYDWMKDCLRPRIHERYHSMIYMGAASVGELVACLVRVPVEVIKQRKQVFIVDTNGLGVRLLYRGYWSTALRDMPFSLLQFPIWEYLKNTGSHRINRELNPMEGAFCGALAGGISAAATTPLDVAKTHIMLASRVCNPQDLSIFNILKSIYKDKGIKGFFAGFGPRVTWITVGGFVFFGVYEETKKLICCWIPKPSSKRIASNC
ncbi:S-adenosylmethionine mitochondrial carrier protein [Orussus abietinus]|uniref:S-adenosylmethionine mitochondrial carrier protein n=1 Tax=Orussus abietinus TaxID=222816 RepID=UPI000C715E6B|nr:S-adenosylmethionine mitochondrial carrier protein [Orussus abietinus]